MAINRIEISDSWLKVAARLQRMGKTYHVDKCKLLRINIVVDQDGAPVFWPEPECVPIEPANGAREWLNRL